jgi:hypothetical protein
MLSNPSVTVAKGLFDRQARLLEYLTSGAAIFGKKNALLDPALHGINLDQLHLEASLSHEKRIAKIFAVFPRTFELMAEHRTVILHEFAIACAPEHIGVIENARQFHGFLRSRQDREPTQAPYLHEVAACELALAEVRVTVQNRQQVMDGIRSVARGAIRRRPGIVLLRCAYDIQLIFASATAKGRPSDRDTPLAIATMPGTQHARVFEVAPAVFDLLLAIHDWSACPGLGDTADSKGVIGELVECGLVEVHP